MLATIDCGFEFVNDIESIDLSFAIGCFLVGWDFWAMGPGDVVHNCYLYDILSKLANLLQLLYFGNNSMQKYFRPNLDVQKFIYRKFLLRKSFSGDTCHGVV